MMDTEELRKAARVVFIITEESVARDLSNKLICSANEIDALRDFATWMTRCDYDFSQHEYFRNKRDDLLK